MCSLVACDIICSQSKGQFHFNFLSICSVIINILVYTFECKKYYCEELIILLLCKTHFFSNFSKVKIKCIYNIFKRKLGTVSYEDRVADVIQWLDNKGENEDEEL